MDKKCEIASYAYKNNRFYRRLRERNVERDINTIGEFKKLPIIDKTMLKLHQDALVDGSKLMESQETILVKRTSGSTGIYIKVFWEQADYNESLMPVWLFRKRYYDINPWDELLFTYSGLYSGNSYCVNEHDLIRAEHSLGISTQIFNEDRMIEFYSQIEQFKPKWMILQPSLGCILFDCIERYGVAPFKEIKYVEYTGEHLPIELKEKTESILDCKVGNLYGLTEVNQVAFSCPNGKLHCCESNAYAEVIKENGSEAGEGEVGDICVTSLTNHIMPFIRYRTGDRGRLLPASYCNCGNEGRVLELERGRDTDYIVLKNGNKVSANIFFDIVQFINENIGNAIKQFQVIQKKYDLFFVYLSLNPTYQGWKEVLQAEFLKRVKGSRLEEGKWEFRFSDKFLKTLPSGKINFFMSEVNDCQGGER